MDNGPFPLQPAECFYEGGPNAVLLTHGLTGTPNEMRLLARGLNRRGFTVFGVQLAGHCGDMDDLLATRWQDWAASVQTAAERLRGHCDRLFVGGLSMGALLALNLAADRPDLVDGVGVYGATFRYDGWSVPRIARLSGLLPLLKKFNIGRDRVFLEKPPYGIRDERLRAQISTAMQGSDSSIAGLPGNPWHSLAELWLLARRVRTRLPRVSAPCLVAHASNDDIASLDNAEVVVRSVSGPTELLLLDDSYHMITIDREHRVLIDRSASFFDRIASGAARA